MRSPITHLEAHNPRFGTSIIFNGGIVVVQSHSQKWIQNMKKPLSDIPPAPTPPIPRPDY